MVNENDFSLNLLQEVNFHNQQKISNIDLIRVAEGGLRSLNNILEKFHQSYFLFILLSTHKFVSVAFYMPIIGLLLLPMIFFVRNLLNLRNCNFYCLYTILNV